MKKVVNLKNFGQEGVDLRRFEVGFHGGLVAATSREKLGFIEVVKCWNYGNKWCLSSGGHGSL